MSADYESALNYISSFGDPYQASLRNKSNGQKWGIDALPPVLESLGHPEQAFKVIHIAGTKGKGSTAAFVTQGLMEAGYRTGLYISPHLQDWRERIQVNRVPISPAELIELVGYFEQHAGDASALTSYEVTTSLAFLYFAQHGCDVVVLETGLGGRLDATNVITQPLVSVITNISYDHMQFLGNTLTEIAGEKAAIIKPGRPVISAPQPDEALRVIKRHASEMNSPLTLVGQDITYQTVDDANIFQNYAMINGKRFDISLIGDFQVENAAVAYTALRAADEAGLHISEGAIQRGLANTTWAGRFEVFDGQPFVVLDSAHNTYSVQQFISSVNHLVDTAPEYRVFIFGAMSDKDLNGMLRAIMPATKTLILTQMDMPRSATTDDLHAAASAILHEAQANNSTWAENYAILVSTGPLHAVETAVLSEKSKDIIFATGSLALAGEIRRILTGKAYSVKTTTFPREEN